MGGGSEEMREGTREGRKEEWREEKMYRNIQMHINIYLRDCFGAFVMGTSRTDDSGTPTCTERAL